MKPEEKFEIEKEVNSNQEIFASVKNNLILLENLFHQRNSLISSFDTRIVKKEAKIEQLENEITELKQVEKENEKIIQTKDSKIETLSNTILNRNKEIHDLNNNLTNHKESLNEKNETINSLEKEISRLEQIKKEYDDQIKDLQIKSENQEQLIQQLEKDNKEKDIIIPELKKDSNELERLLYLQNEFLIEKRNREEQVCDQLSSSLKILSDQIETKDFVNSSFSKIGFDKEVFANLISSFIEIKEEKFDFWNYLNYSFSDHLFDLLIKNKATFSKIFKLYSYARTEKIQPDLKNILNVDLFIKTLTTIQNLFSVENIHLYYPLLLFDKYTSENYDLEDYNMINQINVSYTNSFEYNTIIDLEQVGIIFNAQKIKPKVSKKN